MGRRNLDLNKILAQDGYSIISYGNDEPTEAQVAARQLETTGLKTKRQHVEHDIQVRFFKWVTSMRPFDARFWRIFAVPNGGHRNILVAKMMKAEGVTPSVPDVLCLVQGAYGPLLALEFKAPGEKPNPDQVAMIAALLSDGYYVAVVEDDTQAEDLVREHLGMEAR